MRIRLLLLAAAILTACGQSAEEATDPLAEAKPVSVYAAAVVSDARPAIAGMEMARFAIEAQSEVLRNFEPGGRSNRFLVRLRKPE